MFLYGRWSVRENFRPFRPGPCRASFPRSLHAHGADIKVRWPPTIIVYNFHSSRILELHRAHIPSAWDCVNCINLAKWMGLAMSSKLVSGDKPDVIAWPRRARSRTAIHGPHTIHGSEVDNRPVLSTRQAYAIFTNGKTVYLLCNLRGYFFKVGW